MGNEADPASSLAAAIPHEDTRLAGRSKQGDLRAFAQLMGRHRERIHRVAYAVVGDSEDAEDVTQQAFLQAYLKIGGLNRGCSFVGWMRRITVRCALAVLRERRRDLKNGVAEEQLASSVATTDLAEGAAAREFQDHVRNALETLPPKQRAAMTLFALEDMDLASTAEAMGCAIGTTKAHLHRGRQKLRALLAEYVEEE